MPAESRDFFDRTPERCFEIEPTEVDRSWTENRWLLTHPETQESVALTDDAKALWDDINGERTVRDLLAIAFERGTSPVEIETLLGTLEQADLIRWRDGLTVIDKTAQFDREIRQFLQGLILSEQSLPSLTTFFNRVGGRWGMIAASTAMIVLFVLLGLLGGYRLYSVFDLGHFTPFRIGNSVLLGLVGLAFWGFVLTTCAELLFGLAVPYLGLRNRETVIRARLGLPSLQVRTEDPMSLPPGVFARLLLARTASYLGMAGLAIILAELSAQADSTVFMVDFLRQAATMALVLCFLSVSPILPTHAYHALCGYLHVPMLRRLAFQHLGRELARLFTSRTEETVHGKILFRFAAYTCVWCILAVKLASLIFQSQLPLLLGDALSQESGMAFTVGIVALVLAGAGIAFFALGSIFFVVWKIIYWIWTHLYPQEPKYRFLLNILVLPVLSCLIWILPERRMEIPTQVCVLLFYGLSVPFFGSAALRLKGSIWSVPLWMLAIVSVGFGAGMYLDNYPYGPACRVISSALALIPLLHWIRIRFALRYPSDGAFTGVLVAIVVFVLTGPEWHLDLGGSKRGMVSLIPMLLAGSLLVPGAVEKLTPVWLSLALSSLAMCGVAVTGQASSVAPFFPTVGRDDLGLHYYCVLVASLLWLNAAFAFRQLLACVPDVPVLPVKHTRRGDRERLWSAFVDLKTLLRETLADHVGEKFLTGYEKQSGGRLDEVPSGLEEEKEIGALAVRIDEECRISFARMEKIIGLSLFPDLIAAALNRVFWMEREVLIQHVPEVASRIGREHERPADTQDLLVRLPLFSNLEEDQRSEVASLFRRRKIPEGMAIVIQGDPGTEFYVISSGTASVEVEDAWGQRRTVAHLSDGDYFGEVALLQDIPRTATVVAQTPLDLFVLGRHDFRTYLVDSSALCESIQVSVDRVNLLRGIALFRRLPPALISKVAGWFQPCQLREGEIIILEGERGEAFYVIVNGSCRVSHKKDDGSEGELARLGRGEYFGEISLMLRRPTTATVQATESTELLRLSEEHFLAIFRENTFFAETLSKVASRRMIENTGGAVIG